MNQRKRWFGHNERKQKCIIPHPVDHFPNSANVFRSLAEGLAFRKPSTHGGEAQPMRGKSKGKEKIWGFVVDFWRILGDFDGFLMDFEGF